VSPVKSSSAYAGLANGHVNPQHLPKPGPPSRTVHATHSPARHPNHHRRSSDPASPPRAPIPVAAFVPGKASPNRPPHIRRQSNSSESSDSDDELRSLNDLNNLRDALLEQLPQRKTSSPPGSPDHRFPPKISPRDNLSSVVPAASGYDSTLSDGEQSSSVTPPDDTAIPRMVRKKSGEVVKPSLKTTGPRRRPLSLPSTPVFPKAVHFDSQLEHIRHFLHSDQPLAVSTNTSPTGEYSEQYLLEKDPSEKQYQIELPNFPTGDQAARRDLPVRVESVYLSSNGKNLVGKVLVRNIAFHKFVAVRFTFDHWQTVSEVTATYDEAQSGSMTNKDPDWDRFAFSIKLQDVINLESKHMLFCVRYNVADQELWDNNYGQNYLVEFRKRPNYLLRRTTHPPEATGLSRLSGESVDDFDIELSPESFAKNLAQQITSPRSALFANLGESPPLVKKSAPATSPSSSMDVANGTNQKRPTGKAFANRYDFEASLHAAIANANAALGIERSGLLKTTSPKPLNTSDSYFAPLPLLFRQSPTVQSPVEVGGSPSEQHKKTHLSGFQQTHHFRSRSYPLGSPAQSPSWSHDDKEGYNSDDALDKPPMGSTSYQDFINNYCFVY